MELFLEFLEEYGVRIVMGIISILTYFVSYRSGKKSGSSALLKDLRKINKMSDKYSDEGDLK